VAAAVVLAGGLLAGCQASLMAVTSGQIGCPPSDITISDHALPALSATPAEGEARTWTAECQGRHYFCSQTRFQTSCTEEAGEAAARASQAPVGDPAGAPDREDTRVCEAASTHVDEFAKYWAARSPGGKALDELPQPRDFVVVCRAMPENVQRCLHSGYVAAHLKACEAVLLRLEPPLRNKIDGLFLEAEATGHK
jgi:hypothetical protein